MSIVHGANGAILHPAINADGVTSTALYSEYKDAFVTLSVATRSLTIRHPGIPFLGSHHTIALDQIHYLKSAADLQLLPEEYKVWGPGRSWIWWAWDLRRAGFLRRTERERCIVARVEIAWIEFWIGFTVEDTQNFWNTLEACGWVSKGLFKRSI
jgi:hypothetical protein